MKYKKRLLGLLVFAGVLTALLLWHARTGEFYLERTGVTFRDQDPAATEPVTLTVTGRGRGSRFCGELHLASGDQTLVFQDVSIVQDEGQGYSVLWSGGPPTLDDDGFFVGFVVGDLTGKELAIGLYTTGESEWSSERDILYCFPAAARAEALALLKRLSEGNGWLDGTHWE